ncbi:hypothetical protein ASZ78_014756 [Callipepla squamata]|uniref:Uncharacterized protein n=1 Tax=Callipepla squamata TaxID=9009 RepID=A0A226N925_CALSU|nr:hypothetical protein ASZ78_014756 [Callipepla squamata]
MAARRLWALLVALRAGWCLLPQAGYLHPDEFFQSPEVMAESSNHPRHYTLLFAHTYMPPRSLLNINKKDPHVEVIDMAGSEEEALCRVYSHLYQGVNHAVPLVFLRNCLIFHMREDEPRPQKPI